jgi:acetyl-CoA synthase
MLKEELRGRLIKRGEEIGIPNFIDMIATEEQGVTEDEIYAFLEQVGHPAVKMGSILEGDSSESDTTTSKA